MTTVHEVLKFLFELAPESMKEEWDHVGLQCGRLEAPVHRVLVALDPFQDVLEEAVEQGAELIVAHHPLLFHPVYHVTDEDAVGRVLLRAAETGCAIISMHTNLDAAPGGVNDCLAQALGLEQVQVLSAGWDRRSGPNLWDWARGHGAPDGFENLCLGRSRRHLARRCLDCRCRRRSGRWQWAAARAASLPGMHGRWAATPLSRPI